jgi:hypothetical protein
MITRRRRAMAVLLTCIVTCFAGFELLAVACRRAESQLALVMLGHANWVGAIPAGFRVDSRHGLVRLPFTTYSSSLIALVAVAACGLFIVRAPRLRRYAAVAISLTSVVVWSSLRLAGSFWIVRLGGGSVGWLFADWFGILLVLIDTALGFHLLIFLLLPAKRAP